MVPLNILDSEPHHRGSSGNSCRSFTSGHCSYRLECGTFEGQCICMEHRDIMSKTARRRQPLSSLLISNNVSTHALKLPHQPTTSTAARRTGISQFHKVCMVRGGERRGRLARQQSVKEEGGLGFRGMRMKTYGSFLFSVVRTPGRIV